VVRVRGAQDASGGVSPVPLEVCVALCVRVRCAQDESGGHRKRWSSLADVEHPWDYK